LQRPIDAPLQAALTPEEKAGLGIDNSLGNIGKATSYVDYGSG
jgi:arylsulfatase